MKHAYIKHKVLLILSLALASQSFLHAHYDFFDHTFDSMFGDFFEMTGSNEQSKVNDQDSKAILKESVVKLEEKTAALQKKIQELKESCTKDENDTTTQKIAEVQTIHNEIAGNALTAQRANRRLNRARRNIQIKKASYSVQPRYDVATDSFIITANLPDIKQDDLTIKVSSEDDGKTKKQTLVIVGKKPVNEPQSQDVQPNFFSSSSSYSSQVINGQRAEVSADEKTVTVTVDLPAHASDDLAEVQKTMSFDNGKLTLTFPLVKDKGHKNTELRFTKKSPKKEDSTEEPAKTVIVSEK